MEEWEPLDENFCPKFPFFRFLFVKGDFWILFCGPMHFLGEEEEDLRVGYIFWGFSDRKGSRDKKLGFGKNHQFSLIFGLLGNNQKNTKWKQILFSPFDLRISFFSDFCLVWISEKYKKNICFFFFPISIFIFKDRIWLKFEFGFEIPVPRSSWSFESEFVVFASWRTVAAVFFEFSLPDSLVFGSK